MKIKQLYFQDVCHTLQRMGKTNLDLSVSSPTIIPKQSYFKENFKKEISFGYKCTSYSELNWKYQS